MNTNETKFLTKKGVCELLTISQSTLRRLEKSDTNFPKNKQLGGRRIVYKQHEILEWVDKK